VTSASASLLLQHRAVAQTRVLLRAAGGNGGGDPLYHVHGFLFTGWMLLLILQPAFVAARRTEIHRRIGRVGIGLAAAMVVAAFAVTLDLGRRGAAPPGVRPEAFLIVPFSTLIVFPALIGSAFLWRRTLRHINGSR
jgi:hypothetical protein